MDIQKFNDLRSEYNFGRLEESNCPDDPMELIGGWVSEAVDAELPEPAAMVLSTVSLEMKPSSRIVLFKGMDSRGIFFFSNFESRKGRELELNPKASAVFFWPAFERQLRLEGLVSKLEPDESDVYFNSRPLASRISAIISPQSRRIPGRAFLESLTEKFSKEMLKDAAILKRPENWGGYVLKPSAIEFWQGGPGRMHDRILYESSAEGWIISRLAP